VKDDPVVAAFRFAAEDRSHGASEIEARLIADLLALEPLWTRAGLSVGAGLLATGQPAMAPLTDWAGLVAATDPARLKLLLEERRATLVYVPAALSAQAEPWIERAARVVSISRSSAVAAVVEGAWRRGWSGKVVVLDGSSAGGGSDQVKRLIAHGEAVSQPDASAPRWLDPAISLVVVGADAVGCERFVNCVGTSALLELAAVRGVSVVLVADRGKNVSESTLERMVADAPLHRDETGREWPVFEMVPMDLVTTRISD
jgi:hypothetical protein